MSLEGKKIVIFIEDMYEDLEFWYPNIRMKEEGAEVLVIAPKAKEIYKGKHGLPAESNQAITGVKTDVFDALIIPGGYSPDRMRRHSEMVKFVKDMYDGGKLIAAICHAPWMLASADILEGKKVTSFFSIKDDLIHAGAEWIDEEVVHDGNIITSRNPNDLPAFCKEIIMSLNNKK
jgi:deglycase